jgi:hypothetical protein
MRTSVQGNGATKTPCSRIITEASEVSAANTRMWPTELTRAGVINDPPM